MGKLIAWGEPEPALPDAATFTQVATGGRHGLALKADGTVVGWVPRNYFGQDTAPSGLSNVVAIAAGYDPESGFLEHSLALKQDGSVVAWGSNSAGECNVPSGLSGVLAISVGYKYSVALVEVDPTNHAPVAAQYAFATWRDQINTLAFADLLRASSDPDGDPLSVTVVGATTTAGGTVVQSGDGIAYTPPAGFAGTDTIAYTLTDGRQASAQGTVTVRVMVPDGNRPSFFSVTADAASVAVWLLGAPGQIYQFEASTNLIDWVELGRTTAGANGLFEFTDHDKNLYPYRYYRAAK
jgi:hypothetical protein